MNIIKRHKGLAIIGGLTLILVIVMFAIFARVIFSTGNTEYGDRLNGIEKLDKSVTKEITDEAKELKEVEDITIRTQGKIIYTTIIFKEGTKLSKAKEIANNTLSKYDDEIKKDYDFGFFLKENIKEPEEEKENDKDKKEEVKTGFVVAGTKHPEIKNISWTK